MSISRKFALLRGDSEMFSQGWLGLCLTTLLGMFLLAEPGLAGENPTMQLDTITVTAEKREGNIKDIPSSISVVNDVLLDDLKMDSVQDVSTVIPNLYVTDTGEDESFASMRGIKGSMGGSPVVGIYVDDVYTSFGLDMVLMDVERIEVLRGPQGTLYGRNSEAGIINVVTKQTTEEWEGKVFADIGSFDSYKGAFVVSGPLTETLGVRGAFQYKESDGWFENQWNDSDEGGRKEVYNGRLGLSLAASEALNFRLIYDLSRRNNPQYANFAPINQPGDLRKNLNVDYMGEAEKDADTLSLHGQYDFGGCRLVSITAYDKEVSKMSNDLDFMPFDMMKLDIDRDVETFSQELRLVSAQDDEPLQWLVGAFFLHEERDNSIDTWMNFMNMGMGVPGETLRSSGELATTGAALFGEATYTFLDRLHLTLGLRYDREEQEFDYRRPQCRPTLTWMGYGPVSGTQKDTHEAWLPKVSLRYDVTSDISSYVSASRGFRSGGYNLMDNLGVAFEPEFTWNYEVGIKTSFLDNRFQCNAAVFYIDWTDMQVEIPVPGSGGAVFYTDNAAEANARGAELEFAARLIQGLELFGGIGYTKAEYDSYSSGTNVYDGKTVIDVPEMTCHLGGIYRHDSGFFTSLVYRHVGDVTIDIANTHKQKDYGLLNGKIGYEGDFFDAYVYARNIFDEEYTTRQFEVNNAWLGRAGEPLTVGVNIAFRF